MSIWKGDSRETYPEADLTPLPSLVQMSLKQPDSAYNPSIKEPETETRGDETWTTTKSTWKNVNLTTTFVESKGTSPTLNIESDPLIFNRDQVLLNKFHSLWKLNLRVVLTTVSEYLDDGDSGYVSCFMDVRNVGEYSPTLWNINFKKSENTVTLQLSWNSYPRGEAYTYMTMSTYGFYESIQGFVDFAFEKIRDSYQRSAYVIFNSKFKSFHNIPVR